MFWVYGEHKSMFHVKQKHRFTWNIFLALRFMLQYSYYGDN